jgi:RNA polymerase sigma-70 factor (ECF subfamily)
MPPSPDSATSTSRSLLVRVQRGEADAWSRLVELYSPLVAHWCRRFGVAEQDVTDVLQDVFGAVVRGVEGFRKQRPQDTFRGWLRVIARNKVHDHFRRGQAEAAAAGGTEAAQLLAQLPDAADDDCAADPDELRLRHELFLRALDGIRGEFAPHTWQAFWRVAVDGLTPREAGEELNMRAGTVRVAKSRVLQRLRSELGEFLE